MIRRPPRNPAALPLVLALTLAACADTPPEPTPRLAKPIAAYDGAESFAAAPLSWPERQWWTRYGDAQLDRLIDEALTGSPTLAAAKARLAQAQAAATVAGAAQLPALAAEASAYETKQSYHYGIPPAFVPKGYGDADTAILNFSYELDLWGKNRAAAQAALSEAEAARLDALVVEINLSAAVADAYAELARHYAERDVAELALKVREATFDLTARRLASGLDTRAEYKQAESGVPAARASLLAIDEAIGLDRNRLAALLGAGPDRGLAIARPAAASLRAFGLPQHLAADLLGRRADIKAARARAEAAAKRVDVADAAFYPNIDLTAFAGVQALGFSYLTRGGSDVGAVGPAISLPIFSGFRLQGQLRQAEAEYQAAVADYDRTVTQALQDVADVATSEKSLDGQLDAARRAAADSGEAYQIAKRRYEGGLANFLSVLSAEDAWLANRRILADLESRALTLDIALYRALGGGFGS
jgi:NodT family efflux transporter outer membrane factor (OMF) lipoprotein